jgi:hypothetical protein
VTECQARSARQVRGTGQQQVQVAHVRVGVAGGSRADDVRGDEPAGEALLGARDEVVDVTTEGLGEVASVAHGSSCVGVADASPRPRQSGPGGWRPPGTDPGVAASHLG